MDKISSEQKADVMSEVPATLRKLAAERDFYKTAFEKKELRSRLEKMAESMISKGVETGSVSELADRLEKKAAQGQIDLDVTEKALEFVGPNMGKSASISDETHSAAGASEFERFIVNG